MSARQRSTACENEFEGCDISGGDRTYCAKNMPILLNRRRPRESEVFLRGENLGRIVVHAIAQVFDEDQRPALKRRIWLASSIHIATTS